MYIRQNVSSSRQPTVVCSYLNVNDTSLSNILILILLLQIRKM